jgi:hypothetical protein
MNNIAGYRYATVEGKVVHPLKFALTYHGSADTSPEVFLRHQGLPARGTDIELTKHVEPSPGQATNSAFRGTVNFPLSPLKDAGAALWAGDGGWIYEIRDYPGYDVNQLLEGKISSGMGGYRSNSMVGEQEIAVPARVLREAVARVGHVVERARGPSVDWENLL